MAGLQFYGPFNSTLEMRQVLGDFDTVYNSTPFMIKKEFKLQESTASLSAQRWMAG